MFEAEPPTKVEFSIRPVPGGIGAKGLGAESGFEPLSFGL